MQITIIGHNTVLIECVGLRLLTDPYFGPKGNAAYMRLAPPVRTREELCDVDLVLVSHNHWDHIDPQYFRLLPEATTVLAPTATAPETRRRGARSVCGLQAWETFELGQCKVTAVPAVHLVPTVGYVVQAEGLSVYFAGDTFYAPFMREVGARFSLDVALIPVSTYRPPMTMGEDEAVRATRDLAPRRVIPVHLGLDSRLPVLRTGQSAEGYLRRLREAGLDTPVTMLRDGQSWSSQPA